MAPLTELGVKMVMEEASFAFLCCCAYSYIIFYSTSLTFLMYYGSKEYRCIGVPMITAKVRSTAADVGGLVCMGITMLFSSCVTSNVGNQMA